MFKFKYLKLSVILLIIFIIFVGFFIYQKNKIDYGKGEENIIIRDGKKYAPGTYDYKSIIIEQGIVTTELSNNEGLILRAQDKIVIEKDARIDLSGKGYKGATKDSKDIYNIGLNFDFAGGGGSHGGEGGFGSCVEIESTDPYGLDGQKIFGEGGGIGIKMNEGAGGSGGGFVKLIAPEIIINGKILANGEDGVESGGGGAGGKIILLSENIILNGLIESSGGAGGSSLFQGAGGGGGGIVSLNVYYKGDGLIKVSGGAAGKAIDYYSGCDGGEGREGKIIF